MVVILIKKSHSGVNCVLHSMNKKVNAELQLKSLDVHQCVKATNALYFFPSKERKIERRTACETERGIYVKCRTAFLTKSVVR